MVHLNAVRAREVFLPGGRVMLDWLSMGLPMTSRSYLVALAVKLVVM
jgi:hypothetical protein